jgi:hypothetical protein
MAIAGAAIIATLGAAIIAFGLSMGMIRDHASDGAGHLSTVITDSQPITVPGRRHSPSVTTPPALGHSESHENKPDSDD